MWEENKNQYCWRLLKPTWLMVHWCNLLIKLLNLMKKKDGKLLNISLKLKNNRVKRKKSIIHQIWTNIQFNKHQNKKNSCLKKIVRSWMTMKFQIKSRQHTIHFLKSINWKWLLIQVNTDLECTKLKKKLSSLLCSYYHLNKFFINFVFLLQDSDF